MEGRFIEISKRHAETRKQGIHNQSADELLIKLQNDVKELSDRKDILENTLAERTSHIEKLRGWENSDRATTEDDVRMKQLQLKEMRDDIATMEDRLDRALENKDTLQMSCRTSRAVFTKLCDRENEVNRLTEEKQKLKKQIDDKEKELEMQGKQSGRTIKKDLKKYGAQVREKIDTYKKMREEMSNLRAELVVLQRTEQILKSRDKNLEEFLTELERKKGVEVMVIFM
jgi:intraflagellar transport protein 81